MVVLLLSTFGWSIQTNCPQNIKLKATVKDASELPFDGVVFFCDSKKAKNWVGDAMYVSSIKNFNPVKVEGVPDLGVVATWSPDGQWVMVSAYSQNEKYKKYTVLLISRDGKKVFDTGLKGAFPTFWYNSPHEDHEKRIYEIANGGNSSAKSHLVDLSGDMPVILDPRGRHFISYPRRHQGFSVSGQYAVVDTDRLDNVKSPSVVFTIPEEGKGVAEKNNFYPVYGLFHCAAFMGRDPRMWVTNIGRAHDKVGDCLPGANGVHSGFAILKTQKPDAPKSSENPVEAIVDYYLKEEHGSISVNWVPQTLTVQKKGEEPKEMKTRNTFEEKSSNAEWYPMGFTNHPEYLNSFVTIKNKKGEDQIFIVHYPSNTWYRVGPIDKGMHWNAAHLDGVPYKHYGAEGTTKIPMRPSHSLSSSNNFHDLLKNYKVNGQKLEWPSAEQLQSDLKE